MTVETLAADWQRSAAAERVNCGLFRVEFCDVLSALVTMFAADVKLLPGDSFRNLLRQPRGRPETFITADGDRPVGQHGDGGVSPVLRGGVPRSTAVGRLFRASPTHAQGDFPLSNMLIKTIFIAQLPGLGKMSADKRGLGRRWRAAPAVADATGIRKARNDLRREPGAGWRFAVLCCVTAVLLACAPREARAYLAAGDRVFPATIVLPQVAPSDEFYARGSSVPLRDGGLGAATRRSDLALTYDKTITDRLGVALKMTYTGIDTEGDGTRTGWQNFSTAIQYLALRDPRREFLLTLGVKRDWGGTGARRVGANRFGATQSTVYVAKGLGDLPIRALRPLAVEGIVGYQLADSAPRPDRAVAGFALEYSVPYLESKVAAVNLPDAVRHLTPIAEFLLTAPAGSSYGSRTTALLAPGVVYSGEGWEFGIEALLPLTRATGRGFGVAAQFHIALDFLFPESIGRPFFSKY